jgi:hypothetical protein
MGFSTSADTAHITAQLLTLPDELLLDIIGYLEIHHLAILCRVHSRLHGIVQERLLKEVKLTGHIDNVSRLASLLLKFERRPDLASICRSMTLPKLEYKEWGLIFRLFKKSDSFSCLKCMRLTDLEMVQSTFILFSRLGKGAPNLKILRVDGFKGANIPSLFRVLNKTWPELEELQVGRVDTGWRIVEFGRLDDVSD